MRQNCIFIEVDVCDFLVYEFRQKGFVIKLHFNFLSLNTRILFYVLLPTSTRSFSPINFGLPGGV